MTLPRASYVYLHRDPPCLGFVYSEHRPETLGDVVAALRQIPGIVTQPPVAGEKGGSAVFVVILDDADFEGTIEQLKAVFQLQLPMSIYELKLAIRVCSTGVHNRASMVPAFLVGFGLSDEQVFMNGLYVQMIKLPIKDFMAEGTKAGQLAYIDAVKAVAKRLGAFVQGADLEISSCC